MDVGLTTKRDWHSFNREWRDPIGEKNFDRISKTIMSVIYAPAKFWWGIFFGALLGATLLAPESNFANRTHELFYTLRDSLLLAWKQNPWFVIFLLFIIVTLIYRIHAGRIILHVNKENCHDKIEVIKEQTLEERHLIVLENLRASSSQSGNLSILLVIVSLIFSWMLFQAG